VESRVAGSYIPRIMHSSPLHQTLTAEGAQFGELNGREVALRVGDASAGYTAARQAAVLFDATARDVLRLTGEDRASFLHGMVTNDVKGLLAGAACDAAMLTAKGAMVAEVRVLKREGDLVIDTEPGLGSKVKEFLDKYLISEDAEVFEDAELAMLTVGGPRAGALLEGLGVKAPSANQSARASLAGVELTAVGHPLVLEGRVDLFVPRASVEAVWSALRTAGFVAIGFETFEVLRVEAGVPRYGADMDDKTIPLEANLERAIHYNKGCYIGQEVIARATFRGHMNRKLVGLLLGDAQPPARAELFAGEKKVGWVSSVVRSPALEQNVALGYVHRDHLAPGTELTIAGGGKAVVHALPLAGK
jgi:folate-binding protein YgfZ